MMVPTCWNNRKTACRRRVGNSRAAFTLVEMLVSVALVVLMMSLFAQIFQLAVGSITRQKGMAENDQRSRTLSIVLRNDLKNRTFRVLKPFPTDPIKIGSYIPRDENRQGYFYISENSDTIQSDDVLQFTVKVDDDDLPFFGKAALLAGDNTALDQPVFDDGQISAGAADGTGSSQYAEICYFLRNGNLYRRVLLIREPFAGRGNVQPSDNSDVDLISMTNGNAPFIDEFWRQFDYSAFYFKIVDPMTGNTTFEGPKFHSPRSLQNELKVSNATPPLAFPSSRFGHDYQNGRPREYDQNNVFIGRFTHQETSHDLFDFPGQLPDYDVDGTPDPVAFESGALITLDPVSGIVHYDDGTTDVAFDGPRRGEDILLSNVHEFDIKVWDDGLTTPAFVDLGNGGGGYYGSSANPTYKNRYDTWHVGLGASNPPPFRPTSFGPDGQPGFANTDDDKDTFTDIDTSNPMNPVPDLDEQGFLGSDDEIPLKAIQITIRFFDVSSNQMRQLTIVQSLTN